MSWQEIRFMMYFSIPKICKGSTNQKKKKFVWMEGFCLPSKVQSLSFTLTSCVQTLAGSSLNNRKTGCKGCPLPCLPLMWKVNCYKRVTCKLLVRAITLADKRALTRMGRKEGEVPWSLLSQYNVLDLIEAGKTEQNTAGALKKVVVYFYQGWAKTRYSISPTIFFSFVPPEKH